MAARLAKGLVQAHTMSNPPEALREGQRWAKAALAYVKGCDGIPPDVLLWSGETIPTSSLFSGACYPERSMKYIHAARCEAVAHLPPLAETLLANSLHPTLRFLQFREPSLLKAFCICKIMF